MKPDRLYGLLAEFDSPEDLVHATEEAQNHGYRKMDAYSPVPVEGLSEALGFHRTFMPQIVGLGALTGGTCGYLMQWWICAVDYPLNVGGRPYHSWVAFIPVTFELTVLFAAFSALIGMLVLNGLPRPYHSIFNAPNFALASRHRFFLCIESRDPLFDLHGTREFLDNLHPMEVTEVER